jgi:hypothetical protein
VLADEQEQAEDPGQERADDQNQEQKETVGLEDVGIEREKLVRLYSLAQVIKVSVVCYLLVLISHINVYVCSIVTI